MKTVEEITGLEKPILEDSQMPSLDNYKNSNFETEVERYEAYAYALKRYAERLEKNIEKSKSNNAEIFDYIESKISRAYESSKKATDLNNKMSALLLNSCIYEMDESKLINYQCDQLKILWYLSRILYGLILEFENNFKLIKYKNRSKKDETNKL